MRKNVRWMVAVLVFCIVGGVVFYFVNDILRIKVNEKTDGIHSFYKMEKNTVDVIFFGSSHCYNSIQPNVLWGEYGLTSYVMASPGQSVGPSYYLMKETLKYQKPKVIVLETFFFWLKRKWRADASLHQAIDGMRLGKTKLELIGGFFPDLSWKEKLPYLFPFLMTHSRWSDLNNSDFHHDDFLKGGVLNFSQIPQPEPEFPVKSKIIPDLSKEYLEKMIALCEENGVQLVLYAAPLGEDEAYRYDVVQGVNLSLEKYAAKRKIPFLFCQKTGDPEIDFETDFYDGGHLNYYGNVKVSKYIGEWLQKEYGLADHRNEKGYEKWETDYQKYLSLVRKMSKEEN